MYTKAILFSEMTPDLSWADKFNDWYDLEHIPLRMAVPGFCSAQRYKATDSDAYLAVYEMENAGALSTPAYQEVKGKPSETTKWMLGSVKGFTRYTCSQLSQVDKGDPSDLNAGVLYAVWFSVPADRLSDFDAWYDQDHIPLLMQCQDWRMVRRFEVISGEPQPYNRLALHYLSDIVALDSPQRAQARATPWRARLAAEPWFKGEYAVFTRHQIRQTSTGIA